MSFVRYKNIGGKEYAYEVTSKWDREQKRTVQETVYLGVVKDREKGLYSKARKVDEREIL